MALDEFEFDLVLDALTPRLEIVDGVMVILAGEKKPDRSNIRDWMRELKGDVAAVERMTNHLTLNPSCLGSRRDAPKSKPYV